MKKRDLCIKIYLILVIAINQSFSQNWFSGEPNWEYRYEGSCFDITNGQDRVLYDKDTLINGLVMKKFSWTHNSNSFGYITNWESRIIMYEKGDTVYRYEDDSLRILYDFTREQGDTMIVELEADLRYCDSLLFLVLDTIEIIDIEGQNLRIQRWKVLTNVATYGDEIVIVEGVGAIGQFFIDMSSNWGCGLDHCYPYGFSCFYDSKHRYSYPVGKNCLDIVLNSNDVALKQIPFTIFPNPSQGVVKLQTNIRLDRLEIFDLSGRQSLVKNGRIHNIDLSQLVPGIYYIKAYDQKGVRAIRKVVKL